MKQKKRAGEALQLYVQNVIVIIILNLRKIVEYSKFLRVIGKTLSRSYSEHIENVRSFVNEETVIFKLFSILKEPRMFAIVYRRGGLNLPYGKVGGPAWKAG